MKLVSLPEEKTKKGFLPSGADEAEVGASLGAVLAETHEKKSRRGSQWGGSPQRAASYIAWTGNESIRFEGGNQILGGLWRAGSPGEPMGSLGAVSCHRAALTSVGPWGTQAAYVSPSELD